MTDIVNFLKEISPILIGVYAIYASIQYNKKQRIHTTIIEWFASYTDIIIKLNILNYQILESGSNKREDIANIDILLRILLLLTNKGSNASKESKLLCSLIDDYMIFSNSSESKSEEVLIDMIKVKMPIIIENALLIAEYAKKKLYS